MAKSEKLLTISFLKSPLKKPAATSCKMMYASNGKLEIDNNLVENSIRLVALGKKNYLFAGSDDAAKISAMIYSFVGTCKLKGVKPFTWLKNVFEVLPDWKANRLEEL